MALPCQLIDDVTAEILLRLPPDEPEHLFRAALVCKPWLRIICDPGFRRRYRAFHGAPPLLGLLYQLMVTQGPPPARFASTTSMPEFPHPGSDGCRHGRVLIHMLDGESRDYLLVWDPVTGERHELPEPNIECLIYSAAVLCAADGCDHLDCHGGPFRVVFAATLEHEATIVATVYSSETGAWSVPVCLDNTCAIYAEHMREGRVYGYSAPDYTPYLQPRRGTLVGDALYFTLWRCNAIIKYDLGKDRLSMIDAPQMGVFYVALMAMENTSLGFACIQGSSLHTWSRKVDTEDVAEWVQYRVIELENHWCSATGTSLHTWSRKVDTEEAAKWVQYRVIKLEKTIHVANPNHKPLVLGFAKGVEVIFVRSGVGLFTVKLNSGQVKKVDGPGVYFSVLPYMSFYTPDRGRLLSLARTDL